MSSGPRRNPRQRRPNRSQESTQPAASSEPSEPTASTQADGAPGESARPRRGLLTWFANIQHLTTFAGSVLAAGLTLFYILNIFGVLGRETEIASRGSIDVKRLEETELVGENLDLVTGVFLADDQQTRLYVSPENESLLNIIVPASVKPDQEYRLVIKWKSGVPFAPTHTLVPISPTVYVDSGTASPGCGEEKVMFAGLKWDSVQLQNEIAMFIIQNGYGCEAEALPGRPIPLWESLFDGKVHVLMESWLPNYDPQWEKRLAEGSIIPLGKSLDDNWQSTFVVPTYVAEQNPGLNSVTDLPEFIDLFKTRRSGEKIRLVNCLAEWACAEINEKKVKAYGLDGIIYLEEFKSKDAFSRSLEEAYEDREPWLRYMWGPTPLDTKLDLTPLKEPPHTDACWDSDKACAYPVSKVRIVVHPSLLERAPRSWNSPGNGTWIPILRSRWRRDTRRPAITMRPLYGS